MEVGNVDTAPLGTVSLGPSAKLAFSLQNWKGRQLAHVRKFVSTAKYEGFTKSGLAMPGEVLVGVFEALVRLQAEVPGIQGQQYARVTKRGEVDIVISTVPPDDVKALPSVDVREFLDTPAYSGPTKKGIRFGWDKLPEVITLLQTLASRMGKEAKSEPVLFPEARPKWVKDAEEASQTKPSSRDAVLTALLPGGPKAFPADFLDDRKPKVTKLELPAEPIEVAQQSDGKYVVRSHFGFCHAVRNATEGNFILYANLRGQRTVPVPQEMIAIFRAVKAYENYLRELSHSLIQVYERKSGHRPMAEHQAKEIFRSFGLPWVGQS